MLRSEGLADIARTLRHPHFGLFQLGRTCFLTTAWMYRLSMAWLVWQMTESTTWLGIIGFADLAPSVIISPLAGTLADRVDRLKILRVTQALHLAHAVALTALVYLDMLTIWILAGFALQGGRNRAHQVAGQGTGHCKCDCKLHHAGRDRDRHTEAGNAKPH